MDWHDRPRCDEAPAWARLQAHHRRAFTGPGAFDLRQAFARDAGRFERLSLEAAAVFADLSKNRVDDAALELLLQLARECGVAEHRDAMFAGARINSSEQRAVTHVHCRMRPEQPLLPPGLDAQAQEAVQRLLREAAAARSQMLDLAERIRAEGAFGDVVNLGIGGSDLGPRMVVQALRSCGRVGGGPAVHFVSNMDGHDLGELLPRLQPRRTLFIVASKSFGTAETLRNAGSARAWLQSGGVRDVAPHFIAVSANRAAAQAFGAGTCLGLGDGVGGRYSLWSAIGLPIALAVGRAGFEQLLAGAQAMDAHFLQAPLARNLPVLLALLDLWHRNAHGWASRCVAPYHYGLRRLPAYLQQLEMESNGKQVDAQGRPLALASAPVTWGEVGTNSQHAFFQMLHQGSDVVPVEFVLVRSSTHDLAGHHAPLLANALAQARALMLGQPGDAPERHFPGNRPSTTLVLPDLAPASVGALLALYEHRTFVLGSLWGVNSFDQWGVELGKRHAGPIEAALGGGTAEGLDPSTLGLLRRLRAR
ncbi:MAG TPA: glucose-6-phosphate isomerase [Ottowia sp.]|uniref:glucose-6-phosphate isomerase n=1 Tax=Ottowia sp. TaxID=1898956 RepID=UPI002CDBC675|nr:glucose-6-phosphate isomerase [Ottowia sp.]HMN22778.1 glucose-6-phosphate isomerase [Ottowia sp.]